MSNLIQARLNCLSKLQDELSQISDLAKSCEAAFTENGIDSLEAVDYLNAIKSEEAVILLFTRRMNMIEEAENLQYLDFDDYLTDTTKMALSQSVPAGTHEWTPDGFKPSKL